MVIPIVTSMLGAEYVIYTMAYSSVQQFLFWSHCKMTICGERKIEFRKIFCNVNMAAILLGLVMFLLRIQFPVLIQETLSSVGNTVGPISMIITGMLIGCKDHQQFHQQCCDKGKEQTVPDRGIVLYLKCL